MSIGQGSATPLSLWDRFVDLVDPLLLWIVAFVGLGGAISYLISRPHVRRYWRPLLAVVAFCVGLASLLAAVWSPAVANALGKFVLSPALGSFAAVGAAGLALYGVFRQMDERRQEQRRDEERNRADQYAAHFRWVAERVLESTRSTDTPLIELLIQDLFDRAIVPRDELAAIALLDRHIARLQEAPVVADDDVT